MFENTNSGGATNANLSDEFLKLLLEKVVDNGAAINETREQIRRLPSPAVIIGGVEKRMENVEMKQEAVGKTLNLVNETLRANHANEASLREAIQKLQGDVLKYIGYFEKPTKKEIHYRHFVGWPLLVIVLMGLFMAGFTGMLVFMWKDNSRYKASDIMWRSARLHLDSTVTRVLDATEREYLSDPDQLGKDVAAEEERRRELAERELQVNQGQNDIENLKKQKKPGWGR
jgi:hypothetical protein